VKLAWNNILHDRVRFAVTVAGMAFAIFLMVFQGSLLAGFLRAASKLVEATDADLWVTARGVPCFDFSAPIPKRFAEIAQGVPGIQKAARIVTTYAEFRGPGGKHHVVGLVGADPEAGPRFPSPRLQAGARAPEPDTVVIDQSSVAALDARTMPVDIEINRRRARVTGQIEGFSSFLGAPYVFTSYQDAERYLGIGPEESRFVVLQVAPGYDPLEVKRELQRRLPEADVWTQQEFARRSQVYWVSQTGAGMAILAAALLAFLIGVVVASQTIYATTMENLEEFATLKAIGASQGFVRRVVLVQALACGLAGYGVGLGATLPAVNAARGAIPWVYTPPWLPGLVLPPSLLMCALAALISIRAALSVEPARVFRA